MKINILPNTKHKYNQEKKSISNDFGNNLKKLWEDGVGQIKQKQID